MALLAVALLATQVSFVPVAERVKKQRNNHCGMWSCGEGCEVRMSWLWVFGGLHNSGGSPRPGVALGSVHWPGLNQCVERYGKTPVDFQGFS